MRAQHAVEHFHLVFSRLLLAGPDKADFAIQGGCNLRFFFGSTRYSEDLDLDVHRVPVRTLKNRVDKLLESPAFLTPLRAAGIEVTHVSAPKQTETTQRWKASLRVRDVSLPLNTKVEFSRRTTMEEARIDPLDAAFSLSHQLPPLLLPHYPAEAAVAQKVRALVGRAEVQARDVFDLSVLFTRTRDRKAALRTVSKELPAAAERALELSFDEYASQVISYLSPDAAAEFGSPDAWAAIQLQVVSALEGA